MRVFVSGATGVVGRPAVRLLVEAGHSVTAAARSPQKAELLGSLGAPGGRGGCGDCADPEELTPATADRHCNGCDGCGDCADPEEPTPAPADGHCNRLRCISVRPRRMRSPTSRPTGSMILRPLTVVP